MKALFGEFLGVLRALERPIDILRKVVTERGLNAFGHCSGQCHSFERDICTSSFSQRRKLNQ